MLVVCMNITTTENQQKNAVILPWDNFKKLVRMKKIRTMQMYSLNIYVYTERKLLFSTLTRGVTLFSK